MFKVDNKDASPGVFIVHFEAVKHNKLVLLSMA